MELEKKDLRSLLPPALSAVLLVLAFPPFELPLLAWPAFIPLLLSLRDKRPRQALFSGFLFGVLYFFCTLYWIYHSINHFGGLSFPVSISLVLILCAYLAVYPALFSYLYFLSMKRTKLPSLLVAPVLWTVLEFIRSYAFTGFPWSSVGYSQHAVLPLIQIADITGVYGVSFLVLAVNGAFVDLFLLKKRLQEMPLFPVSYTAVGVAALAVMLLFSFTYGTWRLGENRLGQTFTGAVIQGNIDQAKKWDPAFQKEVMDTYEGLTAQSLEKSPDLIVWPETAVPFPFGSDAELTDRLLSFQRELGRYLLFGSILVKKSAGAGVNLSNSALLLDREGKIVSQYDKIHLVPFGEYVPLRKVLFFIDKMVVGIGDYIPGDRHERAETEFGDFGTLICYEIIFPGLVRKFYATGGDFLVTITNDAWFGRTPGPFQHFSMAVFRAIENRKPVIRAANTGISGFIDSNGRILSRSSLFQKAVLTAEIRTDRTVTFYSRYGDLFSYLCIVFSVILLINIYSRR